MPRFGKARPQRFGLASSRQCQHTDKIETAGNREAITSTASTTKIHPSPTSSAFLCPEPHIPIPSFFFSFPCERYSIIFLHQNSYPYFSLGIACLHSLACSSGCPRGHPALVFSPRMTKQLVEPTIPLLTLR